MTILIRKPTPWISLPAIMSGFIMFVQYGFQNATFRKRTVPLTLGESKTFKKKGLDINA